MATSEAESRLYQVYKSDTSIIQLLNLKLSASNMDEAYTVMREL